MTPHREMRLFLLEADDQLRRRRGESATRLHLGDDERAYLLDACRIGVRDLLAGRETDLADFVDAPPPLTTRNAIVFVTLVCKGVTRGCQWRRGQHLLETAIRSARAAAVDLRFGGPLGRRDFPDTSVDVCIFFAERVLGDRTPAGLAREVALGVHALSVHAGDRGAYYKNTVALTDRVGHVRLVENLCHKAGLDRHAWLRDDVTLRRYDTIHFSECFFDRHGRRLVLDRYRGSRLVMPSEVTRLAIEDALRLCGSFLQHHVDEPSGLMTYEYDPARDRGRPPEAPVAVLRCLASAWALADLGNRFASLGCRAAAERHCRHVLEHHLERAGDRAYVRVQDSAHVGKSAFLLLALEALREKSNDPDRYQDVSQALVAFLLSQEDRAEGFLIANLLPERKPDEEGHTFYAGEALTALMKVYGRTGDEELRAVAERVFPFYAAFYGRSPRWDCMCAWMSKPYARLFFATGGEAYGQFVLRMNDDLIRKQKTLDERHPDRVGAYFAGCHSYSAGVYTESVAEGLAVARKLGDHARADRYRRAILLGLRYLLQCQLTPEDCFDHPHRARVAGGLVTSIYDPIVRIDNVQHAAVAMMRSLDELELKY